MAITLNTLAYEQDSWVNENNVVYRGPSASHTVRDEVQLKRTPPKPTADFGGVARSTIRRAKTLTLSNGKTADCVFNVEVSVPVGAVEANVDALRDDIGDLLISATGGLVVNKHDLTH